MKKSVVVVVDAINGLFSLTDLWSRASNDPMIRNGSGSMKQLMQCLIHIDSYYA